MKIINKTSSHCADSCGWSFCDYYLVSVNTPQRFYCHLFGMAEKNSSIALEICNKIYGSDYKGEA